MSQITTPVTAHKRSHLPSTYALRDQLTPELVGSRSSWSSHDEQRHYPYRSHRLERDYLAAGFRIAALVLAVILATFFASAASANTTRYEISRLASELCVAAEQLSYELKRYNGMGNTARQASRLSREAGQLVDSLTRNRSDSTIRSRFSDVARQYRRLEEAYLRASRNIRHGVVIGGFSRVSDLFIGLDYALSYNRAYRVPHRRYYSPQPLSNFERLQRESQRGYNYGQRNRPGIANRGRGNRDSYGGGRNDNRPGNAVGRDRAREGAGRGRGENRPNVAGRGDNRPTNRPGQAGRGDAQAGGRANSGRVDAQRNPSSRGSFDHRSPVLERQRNQDRSSRARSRADRNAGSRRRDH